MLDHLKKLNQLFSARDRRIFALLMAMMLLGGALDVAGIGFVPLFVGVLANPARLMKYPLAQEYLNPEIFSDPTSLLYWGSAILLGIFLIKNVFLIFNRYVQLRVMKNRQIALMRRLFSAYMLAPYEFHLQRNSAELLRNVNGETQLIFSGVVSPLIDLCMNSIMIVCVLLLLLLVNPWITLLALAVLLGAGGMLLKRIKTRMTEFGRKAQVERKEIMKTVNQGLGSLKEIRLTSREPYFIDDLTKHSKSLAIAQTYQQIFGSCANYYLETISVLTLLLICIMLVWMGKPLETVAPMLVLFGVALVRLRALVGMLIGSINSLQFNSHSVVPVVEDIRRLERSGDLRRRETVAKLPFNESITLAGICYRYPAGHRDVLTDINLRIERGSSVAFIGPTGAGKTTLVDLILGLLPPTQGNVKVDGVDIRENLRGWQANIGYVPQTIFLIDDTIRRNVAMALPDDQIDELKVRAAIRSAQLEEFVDSLPEGLDTLVGERGVRISGGQRQRVGIARALYHDPEVLVLDEGTSALDDQTEAAVMEAVDRLRGKRTIIMIAHRLSTTENCDFRYRVTDGIVRPDFEVGSPVAGSAR